MYISTKEKVGIKNEDEAKPLMDSGKRSGGKTV